MCKLSVKNLMIAIFVVLIFAFSDTKTFAAVGSEFSSNTSDQLIVNALSLMKKSNMNSSLKVLQGNNTTGQPIVIRFVNLTAISPEYMNTDAVTVINEDGRMMVYIDKTLNNSPAEAIACLIAHETTHNDAVSSLNEEVNACTQEALVWSYFKKQNPALSKLSETQYPLIERLNYLTELYQQSGNTSVGISKEVFSNDVYAKLALHSSGY